MSAPDLHSLFAALTRLKSGADIIVRALAHRGELAVLELSAARSHMAATGVLMACAGFALLLGGIAVTLLVAAIFWDTPHRVTAIAWMAGIEVGAGIAAGLCVRRRLRTLKPLSVTQEQLHRDIQCLRQILQK